MHAAEAFDLFACYARCFWYELLNLGFVSEQLSTTKHPLWIVAASQCTAAAML